MRRRQSFTDRRRALLARQVAHLERMEERNMITESLGILSLGLGVPAVAAALAPQRENGPREVQARSTPVHAHTPGTLAPHLNRAAHHSDAGGGKSEAVIAVSPARAESHGDWLTLLRRPAHTEAKDSGLSPRKHAEGPKGGGAALSHGTAGSLPRGTIARLQVPAPARSAGGTSGAIVAAGSPTGAASSSSSLQQASRAPVTADVASASQPASPSKTSAVVVSGSDTAPTSAAPTIAGSPLLGQSSSSSGGTAAPTPVSSR